VDREPLRVSARSAPGAEGRRAAVAVALLIVFWGTVFIGRSSFRLGGERAFVIQDDAMITMAYARNLVDGRGLRWSSALAPVEGFSHPLWLLPMLAAQVSGLSPMARPLLIQLFSLLALAAMPFALARLARRMPLLCTRSGGVATAVVLGSAGVALGIWSLFGMETGWMALLLLLLAERGLAAAQSGEPLGRGYFLLLSVGYLLRMDFAVPALALTGALTLGRLRGREAWTRLARPSAIFVATVVALELGRWLLFGDLLPNTYYLKLGGVPWSVRLLRGGAVLAATLARDALFWLVVGAGIVVGRTDRGARAIAAALLATLAYDLWIGGDVWDVWERLGPNRFVATVLPLAGLLAAVALVSWSDRLRRARGETLAAVVALLLLAANGAFARGGRDERLGALIGVSVPRFVYDHQEVIQRVERFARLVRPGTKAVTVWAGWPAFLRPEIAWLDLLGYNDREGARALPVIARRAREWREFTPGHVKWDYLRQIDEFGAEAFFQLWIPGAQRGCADLPGPDADLHRLLEERGFSCRGGFWLRASALRSAAPPTS